jgi:hypothetical protein
MRAFDSYTVEFTLDNDPQTRVLDIKAASPRHAQNKFRRQNPNAKILGAWLEGKLAGKPCRINYEVVSARFLRLSAISSQYLTRSLQSL